MRHAATLRLAVSSMLCALCLALGGAACSSGEPLAKTSPGTAERRPSVVSLVWFGHSLVQRAGERAGDPPVDLPKLVDDLHRAARAEGRTNIPETESRAFVLQQRHLGDHLAEGALAKLRSTKAQKPTHVIGIGYMHMLGQRSFDHASLTYWLSRMNVGGYDSPRIHSEHIYRFIEMLRAELPDATWVNLVGPALAYNTAPQPSIDARHACIAETAQAAGDRVINAYVGQAFRRAEEKARSHPRMKLQLQLADGLHLSPQGTVLAASVIYRTVYGVDPTGLPIPSPTREALADAPPEQAEIAQFLEEVARDTVATYKPACSARLPEDDAYLARATTRATLAKAQ